MDEHVTPEDLATRAHELIDAAQHGTSFDIVQNGKVVARIVPAQEASWAATIEHLRHHQSRFTSVPSAAADPLDWKDDERH